MSAMLMFLIPFAMPPADHQFWKRRLTFSSKQYLLPNSSDSSTVDNIEKSGCKNEIAKSNTPNITPNEPRKNLQATTSQSFTSINRFYLDIERKVSMKDIGSVASFGNILLSPVKKRKNGIIVIDKISMV